MKKRLLSFCIALMALSVDAQTPMFFVTGTPQGANYIPIGGAFSPGAGWENNRSQLLYLAGEFGACVPPGLITKIYFRPAVDATGTYTNFRVDMGNSNITTLTTAWVTGLTTVIPTQPSFFLTGIANQWMEIPLTTPFSFDPTKSLIIDTRQTNTVPMSSIGLNNFAPTAPATNRRTWTTNPTFNSTSPAAGGVDNLVEYDFGFDLQIMCNKPVNFNTIATRFTADISWDPSPSATQYEYLIDQSPLNPPSSGYNFTNTPTISLKNLPDGTCYYIHVRTVCCAVATSDWALDSFCTIADCKVPTVTIDNVLSTSAIASWTAVPGATGYIYSVGTTPDTPTTGNKTTYTSVKLQGLWPNKPLYFYVRALCSPTPQSEWGVTPFHTMAYTGVEDLENGPLSIEAFPNPVKDIMQLKVTGLRGKNATVVITDITGRIVHTRSIEKAETEINMNGFAAGVYYLKYSDDNHKELIKITKQ